MNHYMIRIGWQKGSQPSIIAWQNTRLLKRLSAIQKCKKRLQQIEVCRGGIWCYISVMPHKLSESVQCTVHLWLRYIMSIYVSIEHYCRNVLWRKERLENLKTWKALFFLNIKLNVIHQQTEKFEPPFVN